MPYNPSEARAPAGTSTGGQWVASIVARATELYSAFARTGELKALGPSQKYIQELSANETRDWPTEAKYGAIKRYTYDEFADMNTYLRGQEKLGPPRQMKIDEDVGWMDRAFAEVPPTTDDVVLFRGAEISDLEEGDSFQDAGFVSTSVTLITARTFLHGPEKNLAIILVPKGAKVLSVGGAGARDWEQEVILDRGNRFVVEKVMGYAELFGASSVFVKSGLNMAHKVYFLRLEKQ